MRRRLLAADYDLTLTRSDHTVSDRTREAIDAAFAAGHFVTLATGRVSDGAARARTLIPGSVPLILCNGGILQRSVDGSLLAEEVMDPAAATAACEWLGRWDGAVIVWSRAGLFADRFGPVTEIYARLTGRTQEPLADPEAVCRAGVWKILLVGEERTVTAAWEELGRTRTLPLNFFPSSGNCLELVPPGVDKGFGLRRAAALLGIPMEDVVAVGDGENDVPMLRAAGLGCAMANAPAAVRAAAKMTVPSCDEDGAAWLIERLLAGEV